MGFAAVAAAAVIVGVLENTSLRVEGKSEVEYESLKLERWVMIFGDNSVVLRRKGGAAGRNVGISAVYAAQSAPAAILR